METMRRIDNLARRWDVSKSEVLRRALRIADEQSTRSERVEALKQLQVSMDLSRERAEGWVADIRAERDAWPTPGDGQ
nr:ribbon-helix-helix protein, CopG family [Luteitalea pratensis]